MPEGPEVRKVAKFIKKYLNDNPIREINIINGRYKKHDPFNGYEKLVSELPLQLQSISTKGKLNYLNFGNDLILLSTLGMSGSYIWFENNKYYFPEFYEDFELENMNSYQQRLIKHKNIEFITDNGILCYCDYRNFGTLKLVNNDELIKKLNTIGPDMLSDEITLEIFIQRLRKKIYAQKPIGNVLINQKIVSGIGNYLRADLLYIAKISPYRKIESLCDEDLQIIYNSARELIWAIYDLELAKENDIVNEDSVYPSKFNRNFIIYNYKKDLLGNDVKYEKLYEGSQIRYIHFVSEIQK